MFIAVIATPIVVTTPVAVAFVLMLAPPAIAVRSDDATGRQNQKSRDDAALDESVDCNHWMFSAVIYSLEGTPIPRRLCRSPV